MSEHAWVQDNLDAYVTGGLSPQECERVDRHVKSCSECAHLNAEISEMEHLMEGICARVRPDAGLEDRAINRLRRAPKPRLQWLRFVAAAAAVVLLGMVGGVVRMLALDGTLPLPGMEQQVAKIGGKDKQKRGIAGDILGGTIPAEKDKSDAPLSVPEDDSLPGLVKQHEAAGIHDGGKSSPPVTLPVSSGFNTNGQGGAIEISKKVEELNKANDPGERFFANKQQPANDGKESKGDVALEKPFYDKADKTTKDLLQQTFDQAKRDAPQEDTLKKLKMLDQPPRDDLNKSVAQNKPGEKMGTTSGGTTATAPSGIAGFYHNPGAMSPPASVRSPFGTPALPPLAGQPLPAGPSGSSTFTPPSLSPAPLPASAPPPPPYLPMTPPPVVVAQEKPAEKKADDQGKKPDAKDVGDKKPATPAQPKVEPKEQPPEKMGRMIIRTGEMEFETDSFKDSVLKITKLVKNKGGFVATVNSDKLPNGKMRGNIVVRMPPGVLDDFLIELPDILPKNVLKNQRIGSQDVGKQYSDIESRLRAARAIEERLIQIIKTGKGEIKDLVNAEKELGVWRTKIEEMEGEIRYLANQVALSTLTIQLYEKEIEAPTAIVTTETVSLRIEVEDVAKSHKAAMNLVKELKGRLTRSDLKQHPGGQFLSILHAEIATQQER